MIGFLHSQEEPNSGQSSEAWLLTFTDLAALLLAFFVMLFSMSSVQKEKWKAISEVLSQRFEVIRTVGPPVPVATLNISAADSRPEVSLDYLKAVLSDQIDQDPLLASVLLQRLEDRLIIALPSDLTFDPGSSKVSHNGQGALFLLGAFLRNVGNDVAVYGHTDPRAPAAGDYPSNWELSLMRARAVASGLKAVGFDRRMGVFGLADSRLKDVSNELPAERRMQIARRVDIVIYADRDAGEK